ncbi:hypothetical protein HanHA300_Chr15g0564641 [Helianthus annuus]|nr:hypothetical protein HanHA300_Chr15g0564641 [Helianthus annuus]KAJ0473047.1 hypothetical protein HanHA89_Chr15g0613931 [Helianthus annuus]KAJ0648649.1 hypothetical protein HanLR1_Chr15g0575301 [Helianthus annuus]KAJ0652464.1 hypothetical protein HanOQP8_Chr15g0572471 [Helianthus annuus]
MTDSSIKRFIFYIFLSCSYFVLHVLNQVRCLMFVIDLEALQVVSEHCYRFRMV